MKLWTLRGSCQVNDLAGQLKNIVSLRHLCCQLTLQKKGPSVQPCAALWLSTSKLRRCHSISPLDQSVDKGRNLPYLGASQAAPSAGQSMGSIQRLMQQNDTFK